MKLVFMGVCGSGKTTIAQRIARHLGCEPVLEADDFHTPDMKQKMRAGFPLTDSDRWPWLDRIREAMIAVGDRSAVVTCSALRRAYRDHLHTGALAGRVHFIFLDAPRELIAERLGRRQHAYMNPHLLGSQFDTLERPTSDEPVTTISVVGSLDETVSLIVESLNQLA